MAIQTPAGSRSFIIDQPPVLQNRVDWSRLRRRDTDDAPPCGIGGDAVQLGRWIRSIGPIETSDIQAIETDMRLLLDHNATSVNAGRRWIAVNGPSLVGKTQSTTAAMLRVHDDLLKHHHDPGQGIRAEHIPVIFVSDAGASWPTLLRAIATFAGIPVVRSSPGSEILRQLRIVLPRLGTRMIVVDDAHMLRRVGAARDLTDNLKITVDALPVSFVFAGAGLEHSALLKRTDRSEDEYSAAVQLAGRMHRRELVAFSDTDKVQMRAWHRRIGALISRLELIEGLDSTELRSSTFAGNLFHMSGGRTGMSLELLKDAVIAAITHHKSPTVADLASEFKRKAFE